MSPTTWIGRRVHESAATLRGWTAGDPRRRRPFDRRRTPAGPAISNRHADIAPPNTDSREPLGARGADGSVATAEVHRLPSSHITPGGHAAAFRQPACASTHRPGIQHPSGLPDSTGRLRNRIGPGVVIPVVSAPIPPHAWQSTSRRPLYSTTRPRPGSGRNGRRWFPCRVPDTALAAVEKKEPRPAAPSNPLPRFLVCSIDCARPMVRGADAHEEMQELATDGN